jgi:hypothetical protein
MTQQPPSRSIAAVAHHEAGHAVATIAAFRTAKWLPRRRPSVLVRSICLDPDTHTGHCISVDIFNPSTNHPPRLIQSQIAIHLAGGLAEAASAAEFATAADALAFAKDHCGMDVDLSRAVALLEPEQTLEAAAAHTVDLLAAYWPAVTALANALLDEGCIEGERVEEIVVAAMSAGHSDLDHRDVAATLVQANVQD